ncbi:MAG TPA: hypothetical protein PKO16_09910, partial [Bacteroidia bacterium]|nr:hypothetical protein [Bacteroidia bacterium]
MSEYITPVGASALVGAGNAALGGYINNGRVDAKEVIMGGISSGVMSVATAGISNAVSPYVSKFTSGIASPVVKEAVTKGVVGLGVGAASGAGGAAMSGEDIGSGALNGAAWGAGIGLATGAYSGFRDAKAHGVNPWTGKSIVDKYYRAVSLGEFDDIQKNGLRPNPNGDGYQQEKLFATSPKDAQTWANDFQRIGGQNST